MLAASYEARPYGVRSGMSGSEARRRCPELVTVPPRMADYREASDAVFAIFRDVTPGVEPLSPDEAFLDVAGAIRHFGSPGDIARLLRTRVQSEVGLPLSVGAATTKFLAKVASRVAKPHGIVVVLPGHELAFLHPLPAGLLWGVGDATLERLRRYGVRTVADVARLQPATLTTILGRAAGAHIHALAWNRDPRRVDPARGRGSVGSQSTFGRDVHSPDAIDAVLVRLADRVAARLRKADLAGRAVTVTFRFADFATITRRHTLVEPTHTSALILSVTRYLVARALEATDAGVGRPGDGRGLRLLGVTVSQLRPASPSQAELPLGASERSGNPGGGLHTWDRLDRAMDEVRERFGREAVARASTQRRRDWEWETGRLLDETVRGPVAVPDSVEAERGGLYLDRNEVDPVVGPTV